MDFVKVLSVAEKNSTIKQNVNYYPTKFTPPKKESKDGRLSEGIKKFLARKEEEERQKALEEKRKKQNLMSLRDHKAQSKINKHLKVCKSANKSVLADAINTEDTAITMAGPSQPDEDDYGYVSQEASAFYNRLMNKYNNLPPEKPLFSDSGKRVVKDIASTKDRVKQALKQQEIEESLPHRRKRKSTSTSVKEDNNDREINEKETTRLNEKEEKPKPKKRPPPPMDFVTLLKIAEKKQHEPIIIEAKPKPEEKERLMTKKELLEHQKEKERLEKQREQRERDRNSLNSSSASNGSSKLAKALTGKITKPNSSISKSVNSPVEKKLPKPSNQVPKRNGEKLMEKSSSSSSSIRNDEKEAILLERKKVEAERRQLEAMKREIEEEKRKLEMIKRKKIDEPRSSLSSSSSSSLGKKIVKTNERVEKSGSLNGKTNVKPRQLAPADVKPRQFPPADVKPRQFPPANVKPRQFPPADVRPRQFPPADVRPRQFPPADMKNRPLKQKNGKPGNKRRIYDDSDEEYDSELDDFIDDGPQEQPEDYSKYISEIFGYDKSKYRHCDDDDDNMESNYAQQLKEEFVSTKLGIMEDLEDIRMEALEKKRKSQMKRKMKK